ncbi:GTP 3',8-cyclase MoaA [Clostridium sp. UBA5119]|uniref:GTP 3',8-cyclase MoaA n=1 Tax=Clostridium sp. UBA5119 TaxID=1946366 RepID=UPI003217411B
MNNIEIRVCLTKECNFKCEYCKAGGEGVYNENKALDTKDLISIIEKLTEFGIGSVRLTGGEPLLRRDFFELVDGINNIEDIANISMVSNGSLLNEELTKKISETNIKEITISMDTMNSDKFASIVGIDCFHKVINGIKLLRKYNISTRINTVVTKTNFSEIEELIEFCKENKASLKLLDLFNNGEEYWKREFIPLNNIKDMLSKDAKNVYIKYPNKSNFGSPMKTFEIGDIEVIIKDSTVGTCYSDLCKKCNTYPCQTGVVSLFLTHDGVLKFCTLSNDLNIDIKPLLCGDKEVYDKVKQIIDSYKNAEFCCNLKKVESL